MEEYEHTTGTHTWRQILTIRTSVILSGYLFVLPHTHTHTIYLINGLSIPGCGHMHAGVLRPETKSMF